MNNNGEDYGGPEASGEDGEREGEFQGVKEREEISRMPSPPAFEDGTIPKRASSNLSATEKIGTGQSTSRISGVGKVDDKAP